MTRNEATSAHRTTLRVHLIDAAAHLRLAARSLDAAANVTISRWGSTRLQGLANRIRYWAASVDPKTIEQQIRRHR